MRYTRDEVLAMLTTTTNDYLKTVAKVSNELWTMKPSATGWSVAEITEHVATANRGVYRLLTTGMLDQALAAGGQNAISDEQLTIAMADRSRRMTSPEQVLPRGRWSTREAMVGVLKESRDGIVAWANASQADLRHFVAPHLSLGLLDGIQWILFAATHTERHERQVDGVARGKM
jgi:hypothetical protein